MNNSWLQNSIVWNSPKRRSQTLVENFNTKTSLHSDETHNQWTRPWMSICPCWTVIIPKTPLKNFRSQGKSYDKRISTPAPKNMQGFDLSNKVYLVSNSDMLASSRNSSSFSTNPYNVSFTTSQDLINPFQPQLIRWSCLEFSLDT